MKAVVAVLVVCVPVLANAFPLLAQIEVSRPAACGEPTDIVSVDLDKGAHTPVAPQPDKALVYVIQDTGESGLGLGFPITRVGMDGKWIGANKRNSYFSFFVAPGEQHLCAGIQSVSFFDDVELSHFKAEAGKVYYFRTRVSWGRDTNVYLSVTPIDSDQGEYLVGRYPSTKLHVKKGKAPVPGRTSSNGDSR
jgi:hypothetical protein